MKRIIITIIFTAIITSVLSLSFSYAATNYAISASKIGYTDNSSLGATDVQAAIDGTCTKFSTQLTNLKANIIDTIYPVGSIYISETDSSVTAVQNRFKTFGKTTTWVAYSSGKTLIGSDGSTYKAGTTGGSTSVSTTLTTANLPSHTHDISHTHTTSAKDVNNWTASNTTSTWLVRESSNSTGTLYGGTNTTTKNSSLSDGLYNTGSYYFWNVLYTNTHAHTVTGTIPSLSTATQSTTKSGATGEGKAFTTSTIQPYTVVYMYKRTA